jgi:hypothetical protein
MEKTQKIMGLFLALGVVNLFCSTPIPPTATLTPIMPSTIPERIFYVSTQGDDANDGSISSPWQTIQKAADTVGNEGTVFVEEGRYAERVVIAHSGRPGSPVRFEAIGKVIMQGFNVTSDYISIRGFEITDTSDHSQDGWGIWVRGSYCVLENNYVHDATRGGILLSVLPGEEADTHDCVVTNNRLQGNAFAGIEIHGRNHLVEGNEIWGTLQIHPRWLAPPTWADADGIRFHGEGHVFRKNHIHDILYGVPENPNPHIDCFQTFSDGSYHERAVNIIFEQNLCENMQSQTPMEVGKAFMIEDASRLLIRNNILRAYRVIQAIDSDQLQIVNNTFTNSLEQSADNSPAMITLNNTPNSLIQNNSFFDPILHVIYFKDEPFITGIRINHNHAYRSDGRDVFGTPFSNDVWNVPPLFANANLGDFHLQPNSPLIDAGSVLMIVPSDYDGDLRPQGNGFDIGADEWVSDK